MVQTGDGALGHRHRYRRPLQRLCLDLGEPQQPAGCCSGCTSAPPAPLRQRHFDPVFLPLLVLLPLVGIALIVQQLFRSLAMDQEM